TFVLVHGFLSSSFGYRRLIPLLAKEGAVIAHDLPAFGNSDKSHLFKYSYHNLATIIIDLIEHLSLSNIVLVGHSMGGQISL
ncbi:alpha/beta fold hydrolase, partial [Klebsiella pneumoniae]|nr:alpha/beta fold hydrolase [Klebsiella pneumoniae]